MVSATEMRNRTFNVYISCLALGYLSDVGHVAQIRYAIVTRAKDMVAIGIVLRSGMFSLHANEIDIAFNHSSSRRSLER